jgi:hypothetical protein
MKRVLFAFAFAASAALVRMGYLGEEKITLTDDKWRKHSTSIKRGIFRDQVTVVDRSRVLSMISLEYEFDSQPIGCPSEWSTLGIKTRYWSFRPLKCEIIKFDREAELDQLLQSTLDKSKAEHRSKSWEVQKAIAQDDLAKAVNSF